MLHFGPRGWACIFLLILAPLASAQEVILLASGFHFPEGPDVDRDGNIYLVNITNGVINKVTPEGKVSVFLDTGGSNQACRFGQDGNLYVCHNEPGRTGILKIDPAGKISVLTISSEGRSIQTTNDLAWGPGGRLYFTSPGQDTINPTGEVHYVDTDGKTKRFASGMAFVNGLAFNPEGTYLYLGEERAARNLGWLWRYRLKPDGSAASRELVYQFSGKSWGLDGMKFDVKGNLWVAMYSESQLWCFSPEGKKIDSIAIPGRNPTNLIFAGADRQTAYVTVEDTPGKLFRVRMPVPGAR